ncbi:MAG: hypothetical protein IJ410_01880 [Oscillospiraceae bacterium]|nr:hypothetical protein [Oscillospiraceae bacterium]
MIKYAVPKGNETCCHICKVCQNPCKHKGDCSGACAGCPHPCWLDWKNYKKTWEFMDD